MLLLALDSAQRKQCSLNFMLEQAKHARLKNVAARNSELVEVSNASFYHLGVSSSYETQEYVRLTKYRKLQN